jgi:hypothetical protein
MQIDWISYRRVHNDRRNLIIDLIVVPLFFPMGRWWYQLKGADAGPDHAT